MTSWCKTYDRNSKTNISSNFLFILVSFFFVFFLPLKKDIYNILFSGVIKCPFLFLSAVYRSQSQFYFTDLKKASSKNTYKMWSVFVLWCSNRTTTGSFVFQRQVCLGHNSLSVSLWSEDYRKTELKNWIFIWDSLPAFQVYVAQTSWIWGNACLLD